MSKAKRKPAAKAAAPAMPAIPMRLGDVSAWAAKLRIRRLNDDGRAAIDLAQLALEQVLAAAARARSGAARVRILKDGLPLVEKQLRVALQADRSEADHSIVAMRRRLEEMEQAEDAVDWMQ